MNEAIRSICVAFSISLLIVACQHETPNQSREVYMKQENTPAAQVGSEKKRINPENWPRQQTAMVRDAAIGARTAKQVLANLAAAKSPGLGADDMALIESVTPAQGGRKIWPA